MMVRNVISWVLVVLVWLAPAVSWAGPSEADRKAAHTFIQDKQKALTDAVRAGQTPKVEALFDSMFNYEQLAEASLRDHWQTLTEAQRKEFTELLRTLVRRAYRKNIDRTLDYEVSYEGVNDAEGGILVKTKAKSRKDPREEPLAIEYLVVKRGNALLVHDVITEGSSLVNNYRKNFNRVIQKKGGIDGLLKKMREKVQKNED